jgi:L-malate glycosyltransferase
MTYKKAKRKLSLEYAGMLPFVLLGKFFGILFPLKTRHNLFLFYPNADIGGAPKVNADISQCVKDVHPLIVFSKKANNNRFRELFNIEGVRVIDIHQYIDNKAFHFVNFFFRGIIASWINKAEKPAVFGGESIFFYKVIPHIRKDIPCIELSHLPTWVPYNIGFIDRIDKRIFSTLKLKEAVIKQYNENKIDKSFYERLYFYDNAINIPDYAPVKNDRLEVVFIGRGSPQKRVHLVAEIAKKLYETGSNAHFSFVGDVSTMINTHEFPFCKFYGNITDSVLMNQIYEKSDVLILTSAFEGLPLVVMTMMAYGKVVLSTAVNGIPDYITHMENGMLIHAIDEAKIIDEGAALIARLIDEPGLKERLGSKNREIAIEKFSKDVFCRRYREMLT